MATLPSFLSFSPLPSLSSRLPRSQSWHSLLCNPFQSSKVPVKIRSRRTLVRALSDSSFQDLFPKNDHPRSKKSVLLNLIQEIEPMDVSLIQKDVPLTTVDAMKRTISGMLGLLPSDQFQVLIEALWEPLSKLLVSSMMTGYTLRNAEYRLCLERNLDMHEGSTERVKSEDSKFEAPGALLDYKRRTKLSKKEEIVKSESTNDNKSETIGFESLGEISPEAQQYILSLQSRLSSVKKELHEVKRKSAALQMQQFVGEEKNDLLDYLRSLQPEKVAELSEPTCSELKEAIRSVVHGLLATLSPKMHSKVPLSDNASAGVVNIGTEEDCIDLVENASLQYQPLISLTRDYLARLLFWCMLLGHYLRGLEYRLELTKLLSLPSNGPYDLYDDESQVV
ncbi:Aspartate kinase [Bertholletia excelsa]